MVSVAGVRSIGRFGKYVVLCLAVLGAGAAGAELQAGSEVAITLADGTVLVGTIRRITATHYHVRTSHGTFSIEREWVERADVRVVASPRSSPDVYVLYTLRYGAVLSPWGDIYAGGLDAVGIDAGITLFQASGFSFGLGLEVLYWSRSQEGVEVDDTFTAPSVMQHWHYGGLAWGELGLHEAVRVYFRIGGGGASYSIVVTQLLGEEEDAAFIPYLFAQTGLKWLFSRRLFLEAGLRVQQQRFSKRLTMLSPGLGLGVSF